MKFILLTYILLLTTLISCTNIERRGETLLKKVSENISYPLLATNLKENQDEEDTLYATLNNLNFIIYPTGQIDQFENGRKMTSYRLHTKNVVENAFLALFKDNLIVHYTDTDFDTGASFIESFSTKTQKMQWHANTYGFNLGQPANKDSISYVSTIGFVGKLNLKNGKYFWKHSDLYDRETYSFNNFDSIIFTQNKTIFISKNYSKKFLDIDSIIVNDATGEMSIRK